MATTLLDCVIHWRKKLDKNPDEDVILNVIRKLSKIPITVEILQTTHIGKCIRKLSKRNDLIGEKAKVVLNKWRDIFALQSIKDSKMPNVSNEDNIKREKSSSKKNGITREKILNHRETESHHKNKYQNNSLYHSTTEQTSSDSSVVNRSVESSHLLYNNSEVKKPHKNMDYDPNTECSETYDPEYPEFFPADNNMSKTKAAISANKYKPSLKRKLDIEEQEISVNKSFSKKPKMENHSILNAGNTVETKKSQEKKDKHSLKKDKNKDHNSNSSSRKKESSNVKSEKEKSVKHVSSSDEKKSKGEKSKKNDNSKSNKSDPKVKIHASEEFTSSHVSFEACLGFNDIVDVKKKKSSKIQTPAKQPSSARASHKTKLEKKSSDLPSQEIKTTSYDSPQASSPSYKEKLKRSVDVDVADLTYCFPESLSRQLFQLGDSYSSKKKEVLNSDDVIKFTSSRKDKTAVYSGKKSFLTKVPTLIECCTRILIENIDALGYMGEVPYFLMKPVLERCTASQLYTIESYNCYLLDYTNELWEKHCKRDHKLLTPHEHETWRDLYLRAQDEREKKLKNVTAIICASQSKYKPVRQVKLAYVDSFAKPPRDVARRQAKNGTSVAAKTSSSSKANTGPASPANTSAASNKTSSSSNLTVKCGSPKSVSNGTALAVTSIASSKNTSLVKQKPKIAPLMAKTLKSMKQVFRR